MFNLVIESSALAEQQVHRFDQSSYLLCMQDILGLQSKLNSCAEIKRLAFCATAE